MLHAVGARRRFIAAAGLVALGFSLTLAGCASSEPDRVDVESRRLPMDAYAASNSHIFDYAEALLLQECLEPEGFPWPVPVQGIVQSVSNTENDAGRRLFTVDIAREYGYHRDAAASEGSNEWRAFVEEAAETQTMPGFDSAWDVCISQIRMDRTIVSADDRLFVFGLMTEAFEAAVERPEVEQASRKWANCMADSTGLSLRVPTEFPTQSLLEEWDVANPDANASEAEISVAIADASCRSSSGYDSALYAAEEIEQRELLSKYSDEFDRIWVGSLDELLDCLVVIDAARSR